MQMLELDTLAYSGLPDKRLYLAFLLSIFVHGLLIVFGLLWLVDVQLATFRSPTVSSFEVSLLGFDEPQNKDFGDKIAAQEIDPTLPSDIAVDSSHVPSSSEENDLPLALPLLTTTRVSAPPPIAKIDLNEVQLDQISKRLDLLRDKLKGEGSIDGWEIAGQKYTINIEHMASKNNTAMDKARVEISTVVDGVEMSTTVQMKRLAFSSFVQIVNRWDPEVLLSQDVIEGRFHSNSRIHMAEGKRLEPIFKGMVSLSSGINTRSQSAKQRIFQGGIETRTERIQFPKKMLDDLPKDGRLVLRMDKDCHITFLANGDFRWFRLEQPNDIHIEPFSDSTRYILGGDRVKISVKGIVKGSVVIHSENKIAITGNLVYANSPEDFPDSIDYLGLISEKYVEIESPKITGKGDITIHAAILAKRRFVIKNPRTRSNALLTIMGSLSAGTVSVSEPRFSTLLKFDKRFEDRRLPGFPVTDKYEMEAWDARWTPTYR